MEHLFLADLANNTEEEVKKHIAENYAGDQYGFDYGDPSQADKDAVAKTLEKYDVSVAYEHVGSYGCDSSSFFILRNKETNAFGHFSGWHCSCYGFEGQFDLEEMPNSFYHQDRFGFSPGGYDDESERHERLIKEWINQNIPKGNNND